MADNQAGIMALPENQDMQKLSIYDSYDATNEALMAARPDAAQDISAETASLKGIADDLTNQQLDLLIEIIQYFYENKEEYAKNIAELVSSDVVDEGTFPSEYDPEFLATFNSILLTERKLRGSDRPPFPEKFARGGIADAARIVANQGRYGDTMLAHITPEEARMLRRQGGAGSINPITGLPEYFNLFKAVKSLVKGAGDVVGGVIKGAGDIAGGIVKGAGDVITGVAKAVKSVVTSVVTATKKVLASPVGRIVATIALTAALGPAGYGIMSTTWAASAAASATVTLASGGSAKDAFKSAAFAAIAAPDGVIGSYVGPTTQAWAGTNEFAKTAAEFGTSFAATTGAGILTGESLNDSVKQGLTSAAISTGTSIAQNKIASYKSAGDEITTLADANKAAGAMSIPSANQKYVLEDGYLPNSAISGSGSPVGPRMEGGNFVSGLGSGDAGMANVPVYGPAAAPDYSALYKNLPNSTVGSGGPATVTAGQFKSNAPASVDDYISNVPTIAKSYGIGPINSVDIAAGPTTPAPAPAGGVQGIVPSIKKIGGGIADFAQGDFSKGYTNIVQGAEDLFLPSGPSPEQIQAIETKYGAGSEAAKAAIKEATPGILRTYGPATAAGIAGLALSGGFDTPDQPQSKLEEQLTGTPGEDKIKEDPSKYLVQNLTGVTYDDKGNIVEGGTVSPKKVTANFNNDKVGLEDIMVSTEDMGQPQKYFVDPYQAYLQQMAAQQPKYYAEGGPAEPNTTIPIKAYTLADIKSSTPGLPKTTTGGATTGGATTGGTTTGGTTTGGTTTGGATTGGTTTGGATTGGATTGGATTGGATTGGATTGGATAMGVQSPFEFYYQYYKPKPVSTAGSSTVSTNTPVMGPNALFLHYYNQYLDALSKQPKQYAMGGIADLPAAPMQAPPAGIAALREGGNSNYPRRTGQISGPGTEKSDSIPAMLSDGEFVMTASAVRGLGKGSRREGAKRMYALMHQLERNAARG